MRRVLRVTIVGLLVLVAVNPTDRIDAQPAEHGWRPLRTRSSLLGVHHWYQQTYRGLDVLDGLMARHVHDAGDIVTRDLRKTIGRDIDVAPAIPASAAEATVGDDVVRTVLAIQPGPDPRLVWAVYSEPPAGTMRTLVDAQTGEVVSSTRIARDATGTGRVFNPNPVVTLRDQSLTDQDDTDYPALAGAYRTVALTGLDGSGFLRGDFAAVSVGRGLPVAYSGDLSFTYDRSSTFFSQTMAYYHVTAAQEYIHALGFLQVNNEPQDLVADAFALDSSFYSPATDSIHLGTGGVDDAEDADIILHEYGHAIHDDQVPGFGASADAGAIGEGFADYWAVTVSQPANDGYEVPCMGDWDSADLTPAPHCLTRVDLDLTVADRTFEVHHDGQIWSRALWDINQALGRDSANAIVLEAQFSFTPDISFDQAARVTVDTARRLLDRQAARLVYDAFVRRGLIVLPRDRPGPGHPPAQGPPGLHEVARLDAEAPGGGWFIFDFEPYELDDRGTAFFAADLSTGGEGLFVAGRTQAVGQIVRSGDAAPGGGVFGLGVLTGPSMSPGGDVAFSFFLAPFRRPFGRNAGVYLSSGGVTRAIVVPGVTPAPTGGTFVGTGDLTGMNSAGTIAFNGMIPTTHGISGTLGVGVFVAARNGQISSVAAPGDPAPGGGTFDFASEPAINAAGDVAFGGHVAGRPCLTTVPQTVAIGCVRDLYVRRGSSGAIERIAGVGEPAPGGGTFRDLRQPVINVSGDVLFRAVLDTDTGVSTGYFLSRGGIVLAIAREGDPMPGGGHFVGTSFQPGNWDLNDRGDVAFSATLDTFDNVYGEYGVSDQGLFTWQNGVTSLVIRSGAAVPDGQVVALAPADFVGGSGPFSGAQINDSGAILFQAFVIGDNFAASVLYRRD